MHYMACKKCDWGWFGASVFKGGLIVRSLENTYNWACLPVLCNVFFFEHLQGGFCHNSSTSPPPFRSCDHVSYSIEDSILRSFQIERIIFRFHIYMSPSYWNCWNYQQKRGDDGKKPSRHPMKENRAQLGYSTGKSMLETYVSPFSVSNSWLNTPVPTVHANRENGE